MKGSVKDMTEQTGDLSLDASEHPDDGPETDHEDADLSGEPIDEDRLPHPEFTLVGTPDESVPPELEDSE